MTVIVYLLLSIITSPIFSSGSSTAILNVSKNGASDFLFTLGKQTWRYYIRRVKKAVLFFVIIFLSKLTQPTQFFKSQLSHIEESIFIVTSSKKLLLKLVSNVI